MQTAFIIMSILGCDDTATQCHHIRMLDERWATIQACDEVSEDKLRGFSNLSYPVVVAVCQTPHDAGLAEVTSEPPTNEAASIGPTIPDSMVPGADIPMPAAGAALPVAPAEDQPRIAEAEMVPDAGLATRALQRFKDVLPEAKNIKALVTGPVHVVTDSYSWVARRFDD
ncbi:hypothetical protein [Hoeflea ulvae]|uniref:Uncharacterized protein n=1 Tax=Hoeflea ulvae TaxID=2983764 RepID=A0ABT3YG05_9HYPH|nr:hypothetical protein [Hoeflea ulvae]MCY0094824.1 hypothetical protein [Hoeflea ulvae]